MNFMTTLTCGITLSMAGSLVGAEWPIITRRGDQLMEGDTVFRSFGLAAPNLHQNESQVHLDHSNRFPDEFEIRDTLETFRRVGARATRLFSLSIFTPADAPLPVYISGRRTYHEPAFRTLDLVLALAREYDVRVIVPIIASQSFPGWRGVEEFAALSGHPAGSFWTNEEVKADFRHLLDFLTSRRNTVSGLLYRDDPAILAWQLGNEFDSYAPDRGLASAAWEPVITDWSLEMAAYLKQIDPQHLVMEAGGDRDRLADSPPVDVMSTHLYEYWNRLGGRPTELAPLLQQERARFRDRKPLMVDECGLAEWDNLQRLLETIRTEDVAGGLVWSVRGHRRDGGFYYHNEGGTPINSYHFPGFASGHAYDEQRIWDLLRREAHLIRGLPVPPLTVPVPAPVLLPTAPRGFTWRGSTGASHYVIERAETPEGPWVTLAEGLHDSVVGNVAEYEATGGPAPLTLWWDESGRPGNTYFYRIHGRNAAGSSDHSPVVRLEYP
jgi:mannan endo-1,4-beta-mannosidase